MPDFVLTVGAESWVDSTDPTTDHTGLPMVPMSGTTTYLVRFPLGDVSDLATPSSCSLVFTAAADLDGTVTLELHRLAGPWTPGLGYADLPAFTSDSPLTWTGTLLAGQTASFDADTFVGLVQSAPESDFGWALSRQDSGTAGSLYTMAASADPITGALVTPTLSGNLDVVPDAATNLQPSSGKVIAASKPILTWDFGTVPTTAAQVQTKATNTGWTAASGFSSPVFDSGAVAGTDPQMDLSATAFSGWVSGSWWTVRVQGAFGWSDYAEPVQVAHTALPALSITSPAVVGSYSPTITWDLGALGGQQTYRTLIHPSGDPSTVVEDSGEVASTTQAYSMTTVLDDGVLYTAEIHSSDTTADRQATPGVPTYSVATQDFYYADSQIVPKPTSLVVVQFGSSPWFDLLIGDNTIADHYVVIRDNGKPQRIKAADLQETDVEGGVVLTWRDWEADPNVAHTWIVKREVNHQTSTGVLYSLDPVATSGMWIGYAATKSVNYLTTFLSNNTLTWQATDQVATYQPVGGKFPFQQLAARGAPVGTAGGTFEDAFGQTAQYWRNQFDLLLGLGGLVRVAYADQSFDVFMQDASALAPSYDGTNAFDKDAAFTITKMSASTVFAEPTAPPYLVTTYDYEEGSNGATIAVDDGMGGGSPGVVDKHGTGKYATAAAKHGVLGYDNGAAGSSLTYNLPCPGAFNVYMQLPSGNSEANNAPLVVIQDATEATIMEIGVKSNGKLGIWDAANDPLDRVTDSGVTFGTADGDWFRLAGTVDFSDGVGPSLEVKVYYDSEGSSPDDILFGNVPSGALPQLLAGGNQEGHQRTYIDTLQIATDAHAFLPAVDPDLTPEHQYSFVGGTTPTSVLVNAMMTPDDVGEPVGLVVSTTSDLATSPITVAPVTVDVDALAHLAVTGLTANTRYYCKPASGGVPLGRLSTFITHPTGSGSWSRNLALVSCLSNFGKGASPQNALSDILAWGPDWLWPVGDDGYWGQSLLASDPYSRDIGKYNNMVSNYTVLRSIIQMVNQDVKVSSDHNMTVNGDAFPSTGYDPISGTGPLHIFGALEPMREIKAFHTLFPVVNWGDTRDTPQFRSYYYDLPHVRVITSDMRTPERNNADDPDTIDKSYFGIAQEEWLYGPGGALDVPSGTVVLFVNETSWWRRPGGTKPVDDKPAAYPNAQDRFLARLNATGEFSGMNSVIDNFLWLGGDRHYCGALLATDAPDGFPQVISSGLFKASLALEAGEVMTWNTPVPANLEAFQFNVAQYLRSTLAYNSGASQVTFTTRARYVPDTSGDPSGWVMDDLPSTGDGGATVFTWDV